MTEFWKSNPRKFCDICKCWFGDNKISIKHHESGNNHKNNVQKKLRDLAKKGSDDAKKAADDKKALLEMEKAASASYCDIPPDPTGGASGPSYVASKQSVVPKGTKQWAAAEAPDKRIYYWNLVTGDTTWEEPAEGYLTIAEQNELLDPTTKKVTQATAKVHKAVKETGTAAGAIKVNVVRAEHEEVEMLRPSAAAPAGKWTTVEPDEEHEEFYHAFDESAPGPSQAEQSSSQEQDVYEDFDDDARITFEERVLAPMLGKRSAEKVEDGGGFKRRKKGRQMRTMRTGDDEED